jgi:hypothetical protein
VFEPPPEGFATWDDYWRDFGLGEGDLGIGEDRIVDPDGHGPRIWFQIVPEGSRLEGRRLHGEPSRVVDEGWAHGPGLQPCAPMCADVQRDDGGVVGGEDVGIG